MAVTRKKVKVVGTETYINQATGQLQDMQVIEIQERDFNFHKLFLREILTTIDLIGNKKTRLAFWIIDHLDRDNKITATYRQISDATGISLDTVNKTMRALVEANFLQRINQGAYRVNPDVVFKGGKTDRLNVLLQYTQDEGELFRPLEK